MISGFVLHHLVSNFFKAATVKMKDVPWTDPGFMGLLAAAGGGALSTVKLPERAQRVFARMMSSESMRVALMWQ